MSGSVLTFCYVYAKNKLKNLKKTMQPKNELNIPLSDKEFTDIRNQFHDDEINYQRLNGAIQSVKGKANTWDTDYTIEQYTSATDRTIGLLDGSIHERALYDSINAEKSAEKPDTVIWLDKSARPVSWFVDGLWEQFGNGDKPTYEFLNIDRVNWFVKQGHKQIDAERRLGPNDFDIDIVPKEEISRLRAIFTEGDLDEKNWQDQVWQLPTRLDGKNILIIDEVKNRGGTLSIATQLLKRAIPEATISGDYFWKSNFYAITKTSAESSDQQMESAPVWYNSNSSLGRGIGEISLDYWDHLYEQEPSQENLKKKLGAIALSAPHFESETYEVIDDQLAKQLEQDIAFLSYAVGDKKVLRVPSKQRPLEQIVDIIDKQNISLRQYKQYREARSNNPRR